MTAIKIGSKIKQLRELKQLTQDFMAHELKVTQSTYSTYEKEDSDLPISKITKIAEIFQIPLEELLNFDSTKIFTHHGDISHSGGGNANNAGDSIINNYSFPDEIKQLYEDKIKLQEALLKAKEEILAAKDIEIALLKRAIG